MNINHEAIMVAEKYAGEYTLEDKIKWLGEEFGELAMAIGANDTENIKEEIGDCVYLLLHIAYKKFGTVGFDSYLKSAMEKMLRRKAQNHNSNEKPDQH